MVAKDDADFAWFSRLLASDIQVGFIILSSMLRLT